MTPHPSPDNSASVDAPILDIGIGIVVQEAQADEVVSPRSGSCGPFERHVLISRRLAGPGTVLGGYWEFPGGKVEPGETVDRAIVRELREELAVEVAPYVALTPIEHVYPHGRIRLCPMLCRLTRGEPCALAVAEWRWVTAAELHRYRFPPANDALLAELIQHLAASDPFLPKDDAG